MHRAATKRVWMTNESSIRGNGSLLLRLEYSLQVTYWSWYVDMQYLADGLKIPFSPDTERYTFIYDIPIVYHESTITETTRCKNITSR